MHYDIRKMHNVDQNSTYKNTKTMQFGEELKYNELGSRIVQELGSGSWTNLMGQALCSRLSDEQGLWIQLSPAARRVSLFKSAAIHNNTSVLKLSYKLMEQVDCGLKNTLSLYRPKDQTNKCAKKKKKKLIDLYYTCVDKHQPSIM